MGGAILVIGVAAPRVAHARRLVAALRWMALVYLLVLGVLAVLATAPLAIGWRGNLLVSGSMGPDMAPGSVLMTTPARPADLHAGRVVVVRDPSVPQGALAHRIVRVLPDGRLVLRGDANPSDDGTPRRPADVLGVGRYVVPAVGLPILWLAERAVVALLAWIALTSGALVLLSSRRRPSPAG